MHLPRWTTERWVLLLAPVLLSLLDALLVLDRSNIWENAVSFGAALVLFWRTRFPVTVFLLTLPGTFVGAIWFAPMFALYTVAVRRPRLGLVMLCATLFALAEFIPWPLGDIDDEIGLDRETALYAIQSLMLAAGPAALGLLTRTRHELALRLDELTRGRERENRLLADSVLATERARLAREMHDVVSHQVSLISIQAGALQVSSTDPAAVEASRIIRDLSVRTLEELRQMVGVLRAAGGDATALTPQPTLADLPRLVDSSGLDASLHLDTGHRPWPEAVERAAYRTVQEALTNIRKHAPGAAVSVRVRAGQDRLGVEVRNGPADSEALSPQLPGGGHGLIGLRERAQLLGGVMEAEPTPDGGFTVRAVLPAAPEPVRRADHATDT